LEESGFGVLFGVPRGVVEEGGPIVCNWEFICCTTPYEVGLSPIGRGGLLRTASSGRAVCEGTTRGTRCSKGTTKGREF
jgi:hypothetical protein